MTPGIDGNVPVDKPALNQALNRIKRPELPLPSEQYRGT